MYFLFTKYLIKKRKEYTFLSKDGNFTNKWSEVRGMNFLMALLYCIFNWNVTMVDSEMQVLEVEEKKYKDANGKPIPPPIIILREGEDNPKVR